MSMQSHKRRNEWKLLKKSILVMQNWFRLLRELFFQTKGQEARVTILRIFIMSTNYTNNSLNQEFCKFLAEPMSLIICKLIFLSIILICSLVGNVLIITVVSLRQELRKTINIFIVNMAVSDVIFPLVSIPFSLAGIAANSLQWPIRGQEIKPGKPLMGHCREFAAIPAKLNGIDTNGKMRSETAMLTIKMFIVSWFKELFV